MNTRRTFLKALTAALGGLVAYPQLKRGGGHKPPPPPPPPTLYQPCFITPECEIVNGPFRDLRTCGDVVLGAGTVMQDPADPPVGEVLHGGGTVFGRLASVSVIDGAVETYYCT